MNESMKNREGIFSVGTRVRPAYNKYSTREGIVIGHSEDNKRMLIQWDDQLYPAGYFLASEVRKMEEF